MLKSTRNLAFASIVAALYAVLTMVLYAPSYGPIQLRFSEALTVLPYLFPSAAPGLFVGCLIANLASPYGLVDLVFGSAATLLAALWTRRIKNRWLAPLPPVICNAVIIGATLSYAEVGFGGSFWAVYAYNAITVGIGELLACYVLGSILLTVLPRISLFYSMIPEERRPFVAAQAAGK